MTTVRKLLAILLAVGGISISITVNITVDVNAPPVPAEQLGWSPELLDAEETREIAASMPPLRIAGDRDNSGRNVRLWEFARLANSGAHLPNTPQEVGDCVSWGAANAVNYLQAIQIYFEGKTHQFRKIFPPYIYGTSRVQIGKGRIRGDGSVGAWAAKAVKEFGVLPVDAEGVPEYSGKVARDWGRNGPPQKFLTEGKKHLVQDVAQVESAAQMRDAICNGYPVTIASNFGTKTISQRDGRQVAKWNGSWAHQMCVIGYDGTGSQAYFYVLNSWGPNAHPKPLQDEPPGGFWITFEDADRIARQDDSWAFSSFAGFPRNDEIDFNVFGTQQGLLQTPDAQALNQEGIHMLTIVGLLMVVIGLMLWPRKRGCCGSVKRMAVVAAIGLGLAAAGSAAADEIDFNVFSDGAPRAIAKDCADFDVFGVRATSTSRRIVKDCTCFDCICADEKSPADSELPLPPLGFSVVNDRGTLRWVDDRSWTYAMPAWAIREGQVTSDGEWMFEGGRMIRQLKQAAKLGPHYICEDDKCRLVE
jgi:hypothetical protein